MSHTPGPWITDSKNAWPREIVRPFDRTVLACAYGDGSDDSNAEVLANALLIAAAPELLDALKQLVAISKPHRSEWMNEEAFGQAVAKMDAAKAAIAKAEGR